MIHIRSILVMLKETRYIGGVLKEYSDVLTPGKYYIYNSFRAMSVQHVHVRMSADQLFHMQRPYKAREKTARVLNRLKYFANRNRCSSGEFEAFYIANNEEEHREVKLFSFKNKRVLAICVNRDAMDRQLQEYQELGHAYKMPAVVKSDRYDGALETDLVERRTFPGDNAALTTIARATAAYNPEPDKLFYKSIEELIEFSYGDEEINVLLGRLAEGVASELLLCRLPICLQHGDLSKDNLLYGESQSCEDFWFIDWEHKKERVFFYDYFFYLLNSGFCGDVGALSCYMSGENDGVLREFFQHFKLEFCPDKRRDYLLVFAICFLKERVCNLGNVGTLKAYCELIDSHC